MKIEYLFLYMIGLWFYLNELYCIIMFNEVDEICILYIVVKNDTIYVNLWLHIDDA